MRTQHHLFLRRLAPMAAFALLLGSGTALAVNPHRPVISDLSPNFGPIEGGTTVTFTGTNLRTPITVAFGGHAAAGCDFTGISGTSGTFTCDTPASTVFGVVTVSVKNHANGNSGTLLIPNGFTYTCDSCTVSPVSALFEGITPAGTTEPNGILEPGEGDQSFSPTWFNASAAGFTGNAFTGALSNPVLPGGTLGTPVASAQYPNLASDTSGQCSTCYSLNASFSGARPQVHVDATVDETPSIVGGPNPDTADLHTWTIHIGNSFPDVPSSFLLYTHIERLVHNEVTLGNLDGTFGPNGSTSRLQMAAFIARAAAGGDANVPSGGTITSAENPLVNGDYNCSAVSGSTLFNDVTPTNGFCKYVHYIASLNVTSGCDTHVPKPDFCTSTKVTRTVMAIFLARAIVSPDGDALVPDANTGTGAFSDRSYDCTVDGGGPFTDVPAGSPGCKQIGFLWTLGYIDGTGTGTTFSPAGKVTRAQMAKFLVNAFNLTINNP